MYGAVSTSRAPGLWGGYAPYQYLAPDTRLHKVPAGLDPVVATLFNPLGAGVRWAATLPATQPGDVVAVLGPGIRGVSAVIAAKRAGARFVMVTGAGSRDAPRLAAAEQFGADLTVDVTTTDPVAALRAATGGHADVVVDVTAKAPAAWAQAVKLARPAGTIVVAGTRGQETLGFSTDLLVYKELRVLGALGVDGAAYRDALALLATDPAPFAALSRRTASISDADSVTALLETMAGERSEPPLHAVLVP
jgi:alcohol dehydrogenase